MELLQGESLRDRINRVGRFLPDMAKAICSQVASAFQVAHLAGVIHRDLMLGVGGAAFLAGGAISGAGRGQGALGVVGAGCVFLGVFGVIPYGAVKILYNLDPGPFNPPPVSTIAKGVAFAFTF